jgi:hypothetical protein
LWKASKETVILETCLLFEEKLEFIMVMITYFNSYHFYVFIASQL